MTRLRLRKQGSKKKGNMADETNKEKTEQTPKADEANGAQWPGDGLKKPGEETDEKTGEKTTIPLVR